MVWKEERVADGSDFIRLLAGSVELKHIQTQRNNISENNSVLSISG